MRSTIISFCIRMWHSAAHDVALINDLAIRLRVQLFACLVALLFALSACKNGGSPPPTFRAPVLETVLVGDNLVPQNADGSYTALPTQRSLRIRVQADSSVKISVDGLPLVHRSGGPPPADGWYEPIGEVPKSGSRGFFWDVVVGLPAAKRVAIPGKVVLAVEYDTTRADVQIPPAFNIELVSGYRDPAWPPLPFLASEVFDQGDNTKDDNRAMTAIVTRGVVLAGWVSETPNRSALDERLDGRNDGGTHRPNESEDWHFEFWPDPDFIQRNYGKFPVKPIANANMPGNVVPLIRGPATPIPLVPAGTSITASNFIIPGSGLITAELNAWHIADRGSPPSGWVPDPDQSAHSGNAWSFDPTRPLGVPANETLEVGDYIIVSGTLWQDTSHTTNPTEPIDFLRKCLDDKFKGHGGWLEIHPVDSVRRLPEDAQPTPRKHVEMRSACNPEAASFDEFLSHPDSPPNEMSALKFEAILDSRFSSTNVDHTEVVESNCPTQLHVKGKAGPGGTLKMTYILWWEQSDVVRYPSTNCSAMPPPRPSIPNACRGDCQDARIACMEVGRPARPNSQQCLQEFNTCVQACRR